MSDPALVTAGHGAPGSAPARRSTDCKGDPAPMEEQGVQLSTPPTWTGHSHPCHSGVQGLLCLSSRHPASTEPGPSLAPATSKPWGQRPGELAGLVTLGRELSVARTEIPGHTPVAQSSGTLMETPVHSPPPQQTPGAWEQQPGAALMPREIPAPWHLAGRELGGLGARRVLPMYSTHVPRWRGAARAPCPGPPKKEGMSPSVLRAKLRCCPTARAVLPEGGH